MCMSNPNDSLNLHLIGRFLFPLMMVYVHTRCPLHTHKELNYLASVSHSQL